MRSLILAFWFGLLALGPWAQAQDSPAYPGAMLFVSNLQGGEADGYTTEMSKTTGTFQCGRSPYEIVVAWKFLERSPKGDVYELTQSLPSDKTMAAESKKVVYDNAPVEVWKEDHRLVMLKPKGP